jgi:O-antigen chain-terminating methyltransferase
MSENPLSLDDFGCADPREFVDTAYQAILGRAPSVAERERTLQMLLTGSTRPLVLGTLRYGVEGSTRGVDIRGLRPRYLVQRLFRIPVLGAMLECASALVRLPRTLRFFRGAVETQAVRQSLVQEQSSGEHAALAQRTADAERRLIDIERRLVDTERRLVDTERGLGDAHRAIAGTNQETSAVSRAVADIRQQTVERAAEFSKAANELAQQIGTASGNADSAIFEARAVKELAERTRTRVDALHPPPLAETMAIPGGPLAAIARHRAGLSPDVPLNSLSAHARYALFESVFYDSHTVAAKQRIYLDYVDREVARHAPFIDLGCGRGEFLQILREAGVDGIGVDINQHVLGPLRAQGFTIVEQDLVAFLEHEVRMFSGASVLQVAEHLPAPQIEQMLELIARRLVPGAVLIVETPNPLSPFALGTFHTDPTHISPIPPERMRYAVEAAGFERTVTLFQARIPEGQFAGPDPRAYYADYAIVAYRSAAVASSKR